VQGTTMSRLISLLGLDKPTLAERFGLLQARVTAKHQALKQISAMDEAWHFPSSVTDSVRAQYDKELHDAEKDLQALKQESKTETTEVERLLWMQAVATMDRMYRDLFQRGFVSEAIMRELEHSVEILRDHVREGTIPERVIPSVPLGARVARQLLHYIQPVFPNSAPVKRHRAQVLTIELQRDTALAECGRELELALPRLAELCEANEEMVAKCRDFFSRQRNEAAHRLEAVTNRFPHFMGHILEETVQKAALNTEATAVNELAENGGIPLNVAAALKQKIDEHIVHINKLHSSEVAKLTSWPAKET